MPSGPSSGEVSIMCSLGGKAGQLQDQVMRTNIDGASRYVQNNLTDKANVKSDAKDAAATAAATAPARAEADRIKAESDALNAASVQSITTRRNRQRQSLMASGAPAGAVQSSSIMALGKSTFGS